MKRTTRKSWLKPFQSLTRSGSRRNPARPRKLGAEMLESRAMLATFSVGAGESIQDAIDDAAALPGADVIEIAQGTYNENLDIDDADGVTLVGTGKHVVIKGVPGEHAIKIRGGGDNTIENLKITGGGKDGINVKKGSLTLVDVNASGNGDEGVQAEKMDSVTITGGNFKGNADDGIKVETTDIVTIQNVNVKENGGDGIDLEEIDLITVTNVVVNGNGDEGLEVDDSGTVLVDGGKFANNADEGIDIDNSNNITIRNVNVSDNGGSGLQIEGDDEDFPVLSVLVENSSFTDNAGDGIQIVEDGDGSIGDVTLTSIETTDNIESGLEIDISGALMTTDIKSEDNGEADSP